MGAHPADILNALQGQRGAPRSLYAAIFGPRGEGVPHRRGGARQRQQQQQPPRAHAPLPKAPRRIPARLQPLLLALRAMLGACSMHTAISWRSGPCWMRGMHLSSMHKCIISAVSCQCRPLL
jgi:hypothetical protein